MGSMSPDARKGRSESACKSTPAGTSSGAPKSMVGWQHDDQLMSVGYINIGRSSVVNLWIEVSRLDKTLFDNSSQTAGLATPLRLIYVS